MMMPPKRMSSGNVDFAKPAAPVSLAARIAKILQVQCKFPADSPTPQAVAEVIEFTVRKHGLEYERKARLYDALILGLTAGRTGTTSVEGCIYEPYEDDPIRSAEILEWQEGFILAREKFMAEAKVKSLEIDKAMLEADLATAPKEKT